MLEVAGDLRRVPAKFENPGGRKHFTQQTHTHTIHTFLRANSLMSLSEKTRKSNHLQMLEQRQHFILNYFKTLSVGLAGNRTPASRTIDWHLTN